MPTEAQTEAGESQPFAVPKRRPGRWKVWVRSIHIYTSMVGLILAMFFGVTGFVLNHDDWFGGDPVKHSETGTLPKKVLAKLDPLTVVETIRNTYGVTSALSVYETDPQELRLRFERPGEDVEVVIERSDGTLRLTRERGGLLAAMTDLHQGKRSGALGKRIVDATAILLITISLTGFILWLTLKKRRRLGLFALGITAGLLGIAGAYLFL